MKVLVLGGTGAMGKHLIQILNKKNVQTFVTTRRELKSIENINYIQVNAMDMTSIEPILKQNWDCIIDFMIYTPSDFEGRVGLLLENTRQYIFFSSSRVYAESEEPITEDSLRLLDSTKDAEYLKTNEYALAKAREENILKHFEKNNWTIVRPYITYSEQRLQLGVLEKEGWLYRALQGKPIIFLNDIAQRQTTLTYGYDVACGITSIIGVTDAFGETYHITYSKTILWKDVLNIYLDEIEKNTGKKIQVIYTDLKTFENITRVKYQIRYDRLFNRTFDNSKISGFIDTSRFIEPDVGLRRCIREFIKDQKFLHVDYRAEALKDRVSRNVEPLQRIRGLKQKIKYVLYRFVLK